MMKTLLILLLSANAYASAAHALVVHIAPETSEPGAPIELAAQIDAPYAEALTVRWRALGEASWHDAAFERSSAGGWFATLPPAVTPGVEYYIRGVDADGGEVAHFASAERPHVVRVEPTTEARLAILQRERLAGFANEVSLDVMEHDFGNRYDLTDRFARGELVVTHHFFTTLDEVGFGVGSISGRTPAMSAVDASDPLHGSRYGFGQLRLRLHPSVFVDGRVGLGVSHEGFGGNVRGQLSLGKPWRSCVQLGTEYIADLGPSVWARLQWDTAPPVLMGVSVVRTDLPGAVLSRGGVYVAYDASYRVTTRVTVKAQVSYGPRDGSAHVGGGIGTALAF
jgi:hypothetical protein